MPKPAALLEMTGASIRLSLAGFRRHGSTLPVLALGILIPAVLLIVALHPPEAYRDPRAGRDLFAYLIHFYYLHFMVFFTGNILGHSMLRQDLDDRTLHFIVLQPAPRWVYAAGRHLTISLAGGMLCFASALASRLLIMLPSGGPAAVARDLFEEGGAAFLLRAAGFFVLGVAFYSAFASMMSMFFKSGFYAAVFLAWESGLPYAPAGFKGFSGLHYLQALLPRGAERERKLFEILGDPASATEAVVILGVASAVFLSISAAIFTRRECRYGEAGG